jgi:Ca-activated chloride channel family protein
VLWQGPAYPSDYISVARPDQRPGSYVDYTYTRDGSPLKVRAPSEPGTYEVRYILGHGDKLLAKAAIEIKGVGASLDAPPVADVATAFEVAWQGPGNKERLHFSMARPDQRSGSYVNYTYTSRGQPAEGAGALGAGDLRGALHPRARQQAAGQDDHRDQGRDRRGSGSGIGRHGHRIRGGLAGSGQQGAITFQVARPDQRPGSYVNYTYVREGSPLKVRAPSEAGTYEVRYILGRGEQAAGQDDHRPSRR